MKKVEFCGECPLFKNEDIYGYGTCEAMNAAAYCGDECFFGRHTAYAFNINLKGAEKVLHWMQKYRRGGSSAPMFPPALYGAAIDVAIRELRRNRSGVQTF